MRRGLATWMGVVVACATVAGAQGEGAAKPWLSPGSRVGEEIVGPDGGPMVWVPAGHFAMGSSEEDIRYAVGRFDAARAQFEREKPVHEVRISKGFWLGKCEITNALYRAFCAATGRPFPALSDQPDNHPVEGVNHGDAVAYCRHFGLLLPTEAQWEYAARGPENRWYPWGNFWESERCCYDHRKGPNGESFPVGSFPAGAAWCGALDLSGNVLEWCQDWYDGLYYRESPEMDPEGPNSGETRIRRGGNWGDPPTYLRGAHRGNAFPDIAVQCQGFRVCLTP